MKTKVCTKCGVEKESTNEFFSKNKAGKYGLKVACKSCQALQYKQYRQENKESIAEYHKQYHQDNKEQEKQYYRDNKEQKKQYYRDNKEHIAKYNKQYQQENKERFAERKKQYQQENLEKFTICNQRRRARKKELDSTLTLKQWEQIKQDFNHECAYCGKEEKLEQEHFSPLSKGGEYTHNNIVPACRSCNGSKHNKLFHEWYPIYEHYDKAREKYLLQYLGYNNNIQQLSIL